MTENTEQMLNTIIQSQTELRQEVREIKVSLINLVKLEERQESDRIALQRMGKEIDDLNAWNKELAAKITDLRINSAVMLVKIAGISGGGGGVVGVVAYYLAQTFSKAGGAA